MAEPGTRPAAGILDRLATITVILVGMTVLYQLIVVPRATSEAPPIVEEVDNLIVDGFVLRHSAGGGDFVVLEFADFECPFCRDYSVELEPLIWKDFVEPGRIRYAMVHYPLEAIHPNAMRSSVAAECAGVAGLFWKMHGRLVTEARPLSDEVLSEHALGIGIAKDAFGNCMSSDAAAEAIGRDIKQGKALEVSGTPTFFLGRLHSDGSVIVVTRLNGAPSESAFRAALASLLEQQD